MNPWIFLSSECEVGITRQRPQLLSDRTYTWCARDSVRRSRIKVCWAFSSSQETKNQTGTCNLRHFNRAGTWFCLFFISLLCRFLKNDRSSRLCRFHGTPVYWGSAWVQGGEEWIDSCASIGTVKALANAEHLHTYESASALDVLTLALITWTFWEAQLHLRLTEATS